MKKFTEEQLIRYVYQECSATLQASIAAAEEEDIELADRIRVLKRTLKQLDNLSLSSPSKKSIKIILQHAKQAVKKGK